MKFLTRNKMILNNIEVNILASANLEDIYNKKFPDNFIFENVIYCVHNNINGKNYIGQTKEFKARFSECLIGHFKCYNDYVGGNPIRGKYLYSAWRKYGFSSFIVYIIDTGANREELNEREMYWIKTLHTCTKDPDCFGYNLTWGADDLGNLCSPETLAKGEQTKIERYGHGGFINAHTPEAKQKRKESFIKKYGVPYRPLPKEEIEKLRELSISRYGRVMGQCFTPECRERAIVSSKLTRTFNRINELINLSENGINSFEEYFKLAYQQYSESKKAKRHLRKIVERFNSLSSDPRWTSEFDLIFGNSQEKLQTKLNNLFEDRKAKNLEMLKSKEWGNLSSAIQNLRSINNVSVVDSSLSWEKYKELAFQKYKEKYRVRNHVNRLIDALPVMKILPGWTSEHERVFGNLTEKDKLWQ